MINQITNRPMVTGSGAKEPQTAEEKQLYKACMEFETLFAQQLLTVMQNSTNFFGSGIGGDFYKSMFQEEMAKQMARDDSLGIAKMMYEQIMSTNSLK